jgi:predicted DNA-binding protein
MSTRVVSVRLNKTEDELLQAFATLHGLKQSDILRDAAMKMIEDDQDFRLFQEAKRKTTSYYSLSEVRNELGLNA